MPVLLIVEAFFTFFIKKVYDRSAFGVQCRTETSGRFVKGGFRRLPIESFDFHSNVSINVVQSKREIGAIDISHL